MRWLDMANLLYEKSNALSPTGAHLHLDTAGWLRTWTPHQNFAADRAASYFSKHQDWPDLEPEASCQLYFRCLFAIENCIKADATGTSQPEGSDGEKGALEVLLVDSWHREGIEWAERRYRVPHQRFRGVRV